MPVHRAPLLLALVASLGLAATTLGCLHVHHGQTSAAAGPPPWAPAHGHRHRHQGVDLVFDTGLGVYGVVGLPGVYFHRNQYLRLQAGTWQRAVRADGPWLVVSTRKVPPGLHKHFAHRHGKRRGKR